MADPQPAVWVGLGYGLEQADVLEGIVSDLVRQGAAECPEDARRAIAAVTFQPTCPEKGALAAMRFSRRARRVLKARLS